MDAAAGPVGSLPGAVAHAVGTALGPGLRVLAARPVGGGCINEAARLETDRGPLFCKWHDAPPPGMFAAEAEGLAAMRAAGADLHVPEPLAWRDGEEGGPGFLVTSWLERGRPGADFDTRLGEGLAALHTASAPRFGFSRDGYCGTTPQPNSWLPRWVDFYRTRRLGHQTRLARDGGRLDGAQAALLERLLGRLDELLADDGEPPALIHGDLWSGNLYAGEDGLPALVDPAAHYAHREAELGMMTLFGGFSDRVYAAYHAARPLAPGWRERNGLYQLYHVLNHLNLFGGGYGAQALALARRYV